ncbi:MAG: hypothetical protein ACRERC_04340 [Candidatus Binatia bacterium]
MTTYDDALTLGTARQRYFDANGFDGSYDERWVKLQAGPIPLYFPNAKGRVRAVKLHDLHHIATGYQTDWTGEAEIAAWEIAGNCGRFGWAWQLNLSALVIGLAIAPRRTFRAFARGRRSRNLYTTEGDFRDQLLGRAVGTVRHTLGLDHPPAPATAVDVLAFAAASLAAVAYTLAPLAILAWWWF